jgi:hypothetical protein
MKRFVQGCLMMLSETRKIQELGYDKCHFRLSCIVSWRLILGKSCQGYTLQFCFVGDTIQYNTIYYARRPVLTERALVTNAYIQY